MIFTTSEDSNISRKYTTVPFKKRRLAKIAMLRNSIDDDIRPPQERAFCANTVDLRSEAEQKIVFIKKAR